jgi:maltooligosyltrehalose synthase
MTDLYQRIVGQRSSLENLVAKVPGYRGYKEASDRRAADRMIREHVVRLLKEQMTHLVNVEKKIITSGGLAHTTDTRNAKMNFQSFTDRVNTAAPGYAGFYDAQKVGPDELAKIYAFDAALIGYVDKFREKIDALDKAAQTPDSLAAAISDLEALVQEANSAYAMRDGVLTELA